MGIKKWTSCYWSPFHIFSKLIHTNIENQYLFKLNCSLFILIRFPLYTATKRLSLWGVFGVKWCRKERQLFLTNEYVDGWTRHCPIVSYLVFQESFVWLFDVLRQVCIENKRWNLSVWQLSAILNLDVFSLNRWWWEGLYQWKHYLVQLRCAHMIFSVEINLLSCFEHFEDALLCECRRKDNGEVGKWSHSLANCGLECGE